MKVDYAKLKKVSWYCQGGAIKLFYIFGPYHSVHETIGYDRIIIYQNGAVNTGFLDRKKQKKLTKWIFRQQKSSRRFIDDWISDWRSKIRIAHKYLTIQFKRSVETWTDEELHAFLVRLQDLSLSHWKKGIMIEWTDPDGMNLLEAEIEKHGVRFLPSELEAVTNVDRYTFAQEEFLSRYEIAKKLVTDKNADAIKKHSARFYWYRNTWAYVHELDERYFRKEIERNLKSLKKMGEEGRKIKAHLRDIRISAKKISRQKRVPRELDNLLYMFRRMSFWRDERKKLGVAIPNHYLYQVMKRLMRENDLSESHAGALTYLDIKSWKLPKAVIQLARKRFEHEAIHLYQHKKSIWLYDGPAKKIYQTLLGPIGRKVVKGFAACRGKARGRAKIIETKEDFAKMKKGDILVAQMTRPEYMPAIRLAAAIVTDEGGITSHAAIISRELEIPCVIGTQVATKVFRDGDLVEVDAETGKVLLLKRKGKR